MAQSPSVSKFVIGEKVYYVKVDWKESETDLFHIEIYDGDNAWSGRFSHEFADRYRERFDQSEEEYSKDVRAGLTNSVGTFAYDFSMLSGSESDATFSWKKKYEGSVLIVHGAVPVHKDDTLKNKTYLIDILLQENQDLKQLVEEYELNIQMLNAELEQSKAELEKFMNAKSSLELTVYGKFIQLLNGKKRRIQLLEQNLQNLRTHGNTLADSELD